MSGDGRPGLLARRRTLGGDAALRRVGAMTLTLIGSDAARAVIAFLSSVAIGRGLGAAAFGRWTLCLAWSGALTVAFDLGFGVLLTREAARPRRRVGYLIACALAARLLLFAPAGLLVFARADGLVGDVESAAALRVGVLAAALGLAYGCFAAVLRASPRWLAWILTIETAGALLQGAGALLIVHAKGGIASLLIVLASIQCVQLVVAVVLWRVASAPDDRLAVPSRAAIRATLRQGMPFALAGLAANAQARAVPLALGYLSTPIQVAAYAAASRLAGAARRASHAVFGAALPVLSHEFDAAPNAARRLHRILQRAISVYSVAAALVLISFPDQIVGATYGSEFSHAEAALRWIGVALAPALANANRRIYLYARGDERTAVRWSLMAVVIELAVMLPLIPRFGAAGAAAAWAASEIAVFVPLVRAARVPATPTGAPAFLPLTLPAEEPAGN